MVTVKDLIGGTMADVWSIHPDASVFEAIKIMEEKGIGAVIVLLDDELVGIMSERDYARKVILKDRASRDTKVKDIMTRRVFHTMLDQTIEHCMAVMTQHRIRHLPVVENKKVVGMISIGDVVKNIIADQQDTIEHLEHCVSWSESY